MTFTKVLPALEAGHKARRAAWPSTRLTRKQGAAPLVVVTSTAFDVCCPVDFADLVAADWEVVEEPAAAKPDGDDDCTCGSAPLTHSQNCPVNLLATIARITELHRERFESWRDEREHLTRERDEATAKATRFEQRLALVRGRIRDLAEDWGQK